MSHESQKNTKTNLSQCHTYSTTNYTNITKQTTEFHTNMTYKDSLHTSREMQAHIYNVQFSFKASQPKANKQRDSHKRTSMIYDL